ncbi:MAG: acyltransferase [Candidatus Omnitrophica bacterium]|nr:acyltransferase [Candidatus Omnitrophota bacterium]
MKAFREIGLLKSIKFLYYSIVEFILSISFIPQLRVLILRFLGASIGKNTIILNSSFMNLYRGSFKNLIIGDNCYIGRDVLLDLAGKIIIGNNVTLAERSIILTHINVGYKNHPLQKYFSSKLGVTRIMDNSFIGIAAIILLGVKIGSKCVVAAGSVVTRDVPNNTVVAGVPAVKIKSLKNE